MNYLYTASDRLAQPHDYMYSEFGGEDFLRCYVSDRINRVRNLCLETDNTSFNQKYLIRIYELIQSTLQSDETFPAPALKDLLAEFKGDIPSKIENPNSTLGFTSFSVDAAVVTSDLLETLIEALLINENSIDVKLWLNRLVQRFEVTKKIFVEYEPGFRKGSEANDDIYLYERFALVLALAYVNFQNLQYLSTLLKSLDLLLSLSASSLGRRIGRSSAALLVAVELYAVQNLAKNKKVALNVE